VAWGDDTYGQTNLPSVLTQGGYWVYSYWSVAWVPDPTQVIAAGRDHNLALLSDGTVVGWGNNSFGQASPPSNLSNVVAITAGDLHSAALCSNGTVVVWGDDTFGQTNVPAGLSNVVAIAAGDFHTLALLSNGTVVGWGDDTFGQVVVPSSATIAIGIASGYYHGLALVPFMSLLRANMTQGGLVIQWNGSGNLQWAPKVTGPYATVPSLGSSWTNLDMSAPAKFFRLQR
jgi:alpha-tubulin suppressor-like RCC1 family protein